MVWPGLSTATVEEQRKRLPPPARACSDPIAGLWMGHQYLRDHWNRFTLDIRRPDPDAPDLHGEIRSHFWEAPTHVEQPPACDGVSDQFKGVMPATGRFEENHVSFTGHSYQVVESICGNLRSYYPDAFSGALSPDGTEFISQNDDGHNPVIPVLFRRIKCDEPDRPTPDLPPPRVPPAYSQGCGCF